MMLQYLIYVLNLYIYVGLAFTIIRLFVYVT